MLALLRSSLSSLFAVTAVAAGRIALTAERHPVFAGGVGRTFAHHGSTYPIPGRWRLPPLPKGSVCKSQTVHTPYSAITPFIGRVNYQTSREQQSLDHYTTVLQSVRLDLCPWPCFVSLHGRIISGGAMAHQMWWPDGSGLPALEQFRRPLHRHEPTQ